MNPTTDVFEKRIAAIEGGTGALGVIRIKRSAFIGNNGFFGLLPNLFAKTGLFLISKYEQEQLNRLPEHF